MQCKDIDDLPILKFLDSLHGRWANWFDAKFCNSVRNAMPPETPDKLVLAKMKTLIRRGLVSGCDCGCRGDFVLTEMGAAFLMQHGYTPQSTPLSTEADPVDPFGFMLIKSSNSQNR
jgi:hypothetical protein